MRRYPIHLRHVVLGGLACVTLALPSLVQAQASPPDVPPLPDPVAISVDPTSTAVLVLDVTTGPCTSDSCLGTLAPISQLLAKARAANALVVYSLGSAPGQTVLPQVAPQPGDPSVNGRADKFFGTNLDQILKSHGIQTLVVTGTAANGAVLYSTFDANNLGYTVAVAEDGISGDPPFATYAAEWQLANEPGFSNPTNQPLLAHAVTLTRGDLVTFSGTATSGK